MPDHYKSDFFLITGFLGSGKTTFLRYILNTIGEKYRIAIIQNEFAPTGVDGKELKHTGKKFTLVEINNGSVFCVCQLSNFISTMEKLLEKYTPEMVFLEASGLSDPINILELLQYGNLQKKLNLRHIYAIADASNFFRSVNMPERIRHQLMIADTIILNKTDLCKEGTGKTEAEIRKLNPFADIIKTTYCEAILNGILEKRETSHTPAERFTGSKSAGRPDINTCVLRTHDKISEKNLYAFINELVPDSIRIKGFVNLSDGRTMAVQTVFEHVEYKEIEKYSGPIEIIVFSNNLTVKDVYGEFKKKISGTFTF